LTKLHELCAIQTQVTAEGAKKFQQAMPTCEIRFNGGVLAAQKVPEEQVAPAKPQLVKSGVALKQDDVIAEIKKLGGSVTLDEKRPEKPVIGVSIAIVPALPWRKDIEHPRSFTDAEMTYLEGLTELQQLHLFGTKITDAGLEHLKGLTRLQQVDLRGAKITGTGLEYLKGMTQLRNLDLSGSKVTDTGLEHLKGLPQLLVLNLNCTEITDAGLENLKGLTTLKELKLWGTKVTDTGLEHLRGLTYLHDLCLLDTPVTYEGAKKFHLAVPNCTIGTAHGALAAQQAAPALIPAPPAAIAAAGAGRKSDGPPKELAVDLGGGIKLEMVLIPAGEFMMGSPDSDKFGKAEIPQHRVRITKPFYLGKYLVTQEQWKVVMDCYPPGFWGPKNPRTDASWYDCWTFLDKLNQKVGGGRFLLPTEAQWEYACRAGSTTKYCFGNEESGLADYAWYMSNSDHTTHPVGEKKPNAWGLYDMHGNVWEWCQDWCDDGYYARSPTDDPEGPANPSSPPGLATGSDPSRVCRGGSTGHPVECRSACRYSAPPNDRRGNVGLRVSFVLEDK
jgi:formylglycine-generating enzyme required for sulfatase activity